MDRVESCPFCGSDNLHLAIYLGPRGCLKCGHCGAQGPMVHVYGKSDNGDRSGPVTMEDATQTLLEPATEAWNRRSTEGDPL